MSNHMHWIASTPDSVSLAAIVRDFKKFTVTQRIQSIQSDNESRRDWLLNLFGFAGKFNASNTSYQLWQNGNHAEALFSPKMFKQKLDYIHFTPVRNGLVELPEQYRYSSAQDYRVEAGLLPVEPVGLKDFV